jgi:hypothetical protein
MLRDYELALSNYRLLSTDYKLDKAWKRFAGVQVLEFFNLCLNLHISFVIFLCLTWCNKMVIPKEYPHYVNWACWFSLAHWSLFSYLISNVWLGFYSVVDLWNHFKIAELLLHKWWNKIEYMLTYCPKVQLDIPFMIVWPSVIVSEAPTWYSFHDSILAILQEMSGLCYFMLDQSRKDAEYCMENAFSTYLVFLNSTSVFDV